jgi:hypothetical protein
MNWPVAEDFLNGYLPPPEHWQKPGVIMFFNLECAACVSRGIPLIKRYHARYAEGFHFLLIHTSLGHRMLSQEEVKPTLKTFVIDFAKISFSVALDLKGKLAHHYKIEGTPHWLIFGPQGDLLRSIFGSQDNAQTRLEYLLEEIDPCS